MPSIPRYSSKILLPYTHLKNIKGKLFHCKIPVSFNYWLKLPHEKLNKITSTVKMLQTTSSLIDDIEDNTLLRGNVPTAHCVFGIPLTINASLHVLNIVLENVIQLGHPKAPAIFSEHMMELIKGQSTEIYWRDNYICPTEEEYKDMVIGKTGGLFLFAVRLMQLFSEDQRDFSKLTKLISIYFQIRDDYCNLINQQALDDFTSSTDSQALEENSFADDITEGKFSFPVINALGKQEGGQLFICSALSFSQFSVNKEENIYILKQRTRDERVKKYFVSQLEELGSLQYTRDTLLRLDHETRLEIDNLGGNPEMESVLDKLLSWQTPGK